MMMNAVNGAKSWLKENQTLVYFLIAQAFALTSGGAWGLSYMVQLEHRVVTLETRGSPHLNEINNRLTVLEKQTEANKASIDRIVDVMTKKLNVNP
jgi:uncharacterized coiled-coil protein SlyX